MDSSHPHIIQIRPSAGCPPKCQTCSGHIKSSSQDLTLEEIKENVDFFIERFGVDEIIFSGLEITLRKDFADILDFVKSKNFRLVTLLSSGIHWSASKAKASLGIVDRVIIAFTPASTSDFENSKGNFSKILRNVKLLTEKGIRIETNTIVQNHIVVLLPTITEVLLALNLKNPTITFPFVLGDPEKVAVSNVPSWESAKHSIFNTLDKLESLKVKLKNIPLCLLGEYRKYTTKTVARFLIEPDRQLDNHALIPPFNGLGYTEACGSCDLKNNCDGVWTKYVSSGLFPSPIPILEFIKVD